MVNHSHRRTAVLQRHLERGQRESDVQVACHGPAHDTTRAGVEDNRQEEKALLGRNVGDICHPDAVGRCRHKRSLDEIRRTRTHGIAPGGAKAAAVTTGHAGKAHEPRDALAGAALALGAQLSMDARGAVGGATRGVNPPDALLQVSIGFSTP